MVAFVRMWNPFIYSRETGTIHSDGSTYPHLIKGSNAGMAPYVDNTGV